MKLFICLLLSLPVYGANETVFGQDERYFASQDDKKAKAVAALFYYTNFTPSDDVPVSKVHGYSLEEIWELCPNEKFGKNMIAATCSGFLVAKDIILTAAHCLHFTTCETSRWVFNYYNDQVKDYAATFKSSDIYRCKKIIKERFQMSDGLPYFDYAFIKLDREVKGVLPLKLNKDKPNFNGNTFTVIGHPHGLPKVISPNADLIDNDESKNFFSITSDTSEMNSGSPVINDQTGFVEGILVRGDSDFFYDNNKQCYRTKKCLKTTCRGEDVYKSAKIPAIN